MEHFDINFLGSIVLVSSNYLQEICSNPSFMEIRKGIEARKDLKFGSNSNAVFSDGKSLSQRLIWIMLVLTSLPVHIMINGIMGPAVISIVAGSQAIQTTHHEAQICPSYALNWTVVHSVQCAEMLHKSIAYVTDFQNITILVNPDSE